MRLPISYNYNTEREQRFILSVCRQPERKLGRVRRVRGRKGKEARLQDACTIERKATCAFNNTVLPPSLCGPGLYSGGGREGTGKQT